MKVKVGFSLLFLFAFVFAAGMVTSNVDAGQLCVRSQCVCELYCSSETGGICKFPWNPDYKMYQINCQILPGENCNDCSQFDWELVGCCRFPF